MKQTSLQKNDQFKQLLNDLGKHLVSQKPATVEEAMEQKLHGDGEVVETYIKSAIATIGEKISLRRFEVIEKNRCRCIWTLPTYGW